MFQKLYLVIDNAGPELNLGKGLHIAHLNVRSLLGGHKFDMLKHQIMESGIQVFTLSESWLTEAIPDKVIKVEGFDSIRLDRRWRDGDNENDTAPKRRGTGLLHKGRH